MNFFTRIAFFGACFLFTFVSGKAQPGISLPTLLQVPAGTDILLPMRVQSFVGITGVQTAVKWDPAVLQFDTVFAFTLPGLDPQDFNTAEAADSGRIRILWTSPNIQNGGTTVADNTPICTLRFHVTGPVNSGTPVSFAEILPLTVFEIVNNQSQSFTLSTANVTQGFVCVGCIVDAGSPDQDKWNLTISPNPALVEMLEFQLTMPAETPVQWQIHNVEGKLIAGGEAVHAGAGKQNFRQSLGPVPKGLYFLSIRTDAGKITRAFLFQ